MPVFYWEMKFTILSITYMHKMFPAFFQRRSNKVEYLQVLIFVFKIPDSSIRHIQDHIIFFIARNISNIRTNKLRSQSLRNSRSFGSLYIFLPNINSYDRETSS